MKGFKTVLFGLVVALGGSAITYFEGLKNALATCSVDSASNIEVCSLPDYTALVVGGVIIGLRFITNSSIFNK